MVESRQKSVSFSGHRPEKISGWKADNDTECRIRKAVRDAVKMHCSLGYQTFFSGMAPGFDLWAADEVIKLHSEGYAAIELVAVIPFAGHERTIAQEYQELYQHIIKSADKVVTVCEHYSLSAYKLRNDYLVDHAAALICYFEGTAGGTKYTVSQARRSRLTVTNLAAPELF